MKKKSTEVLFVRFAGFHLFEKLCGMYLNKFAIITYLYFLDLFICMHSVEFKNTNAHFAFLEFAFSAQSRICKRACMLYTHKNKFFFANSKLTRIFSIRPFKCSFTGALFSENARTVSDCWWNGFISFLFFQIWKRPKRHKRRPKPFAAAERRKDLFGAAPAAARDAGSLHDAKVGFSSFFLQFLFI